MSTISKMGKMKTHGGAGRGQGRKPLVPGSETVVLSARVTIEQRDKYARLGAAEWLRKKIDLARDPAVKE